MGNRGVLHDEGRRVVRNHSGKAWISCLLEFKGQRRELMRPGHYTELFFLDEPTALAAGHRPCALCRRDAYSSFRDCFVSANPGALNGMKPGAPAIDSVLHAARITRGHRKVAYSEHLGRLPDGVLVELGAPGTAVALLRDGALHQWSPGGYGEPIPADPGTEVWVLTPEPVVRTIRAGYDPLDPA